ncbi:SOS response-associated peptidase [Luteibaculum oceani]|uniref:Abasic site processing protein n=1 Tax=Luteibaculum oceani TaxID=1294296 RepID=A0A5C6UZE2_9FLAO|nr:SOS response-associated peptidase [Luteibaculum oceani]TXC78637.1 SOS response-associated peptidase [Luteibaculum oceani]
MCYDVQTNLEAQLKRAKRLNDPKAIAEITEKLKPYTKNYFHAPGFAHPMLLIYGNDNPTEPAPATWGLIPSWVKSDADKLKLWNNTLNAKSETIFEKPAFRASAKQMRCIVPVVAFFEHHHKGGKSYPYRIFRKDGAPMHLAGLWSEWTNRETGEIVKSFSIVTTQANELLSTIHNNPKMNEARMPVILTEESENIWLDTATHGELDKEVKNLLNPYPSEEMDAYPVARLRGKEAVGNSEELTEKKYYPELEENQGSLF